VSSGHLPDEPLTSFHTAPSLPNCTHATSPVHHLFAFHPLSRLTNYRYGDLTPRSSAHKCQRRSHTNRVLTGNPSFWSGGCRSDQNFDCHCDEYWNDKCHDPRNRGQQPGIHHILREPATGIGRWSECDNGCNLHSDGDRMGWRRHQIREERVECRSLSSGGGFRH
jgi:hypothetical protein